MKYLKGINESLNSKELTKDEFFSTVRDKCKKFIQWGELNSYDYDKGSLIFRKSAEDLGNYALVNPKLSSVERLSRNYDSNYHNLIISNLESWNGWPKRNRSLICASYVRAYRHGYKNPNANLYIVIPFDNTKVATSDGDEFWYTFRNLPYYKSMIEGGKENSYTKRLKNSGINYWTSNLMNDLGITEDRNWDKLKNQLEEAKPSNKVKEKYFTNVNGRYMYRNYLNLLENLSVFLDPILNKFVTGDILDTMTNYSQLNIIEPIENNLHTSESKESWMEDEAILVKSDIFFSNSI